MKYFLPLFLVFLMLMPVSAAADDPVTAQGWAVMLCSADGFSGADAESCLTHAFRNGWISLCAVTEPGVFLCRMSACESALAFAGITARELPLPRAEAVMKAAAEAGLCSADAAPFEIITQSEAELILQRLRDVRPCVSRSFMGITVNNPGGGDITPFLIMLERIPAPLLERFHSKGWIFSVDHGHLRALSEKLGMPCAGATDLSCRQIFVSEARAVFHEFGHFLHSELGFPKEVLRLYRLESASAVFLGEYARENHLEYFAEYFAFLLENRSDADALERMAELTPRTFRFFKQLGKETGFTGRTFLSSCSS